MSSNGSEVTEGLYESARSGNVAAGELWVRDKYGQNAEQDAKVIEALEQAASMGSTAAYKAIMRAKRGEGLYDKKRERGTSWGDKTSREGREIGPLPDGDVNKRRVGRCRNDFKKFCQTYKPKTFSKKWSTDHLNAITRIEKSVLHGGLYAFALPRGSGKTSLCETSIEWAILYGHRRFVMLVGSDEAHAEMMLLNIRNEFENNALYLLDFPSATWPIVALEGISKRASGQLYNGKQTHINWTAKQLTMATINGGLSSGARIKIAGITGRIRGAKATTPSGDSIRPDLVVIDDPQTDESAASPTQCETRLGVLSGAILGLAGPGEKIAGFMPCTVIKKGDMADTILNTELHPDWQGHRSKMLLAMPEDEMLWLEYERVRGIGLREGHGMGPATDFYKKHRKKLDKGAKVSWPERFNHDELSAIQHAMNLKIQTGATFWAEYQNEPEDEQLDTQIVTYDDVLSKTNGLPRFRLPVDVSHVVAGVDIQEKALYYVVMGVTDDFVGYVVDYGIFPEQPTLDIPLSKIVNSLQRKKPEMQIEGQIYWGLDVLINQVLCPWEYTRDDSTLLKIERCVIDANWGTSRNTVYQFCRMSPYAAIVMPAHGKYVGAKSIPFMDYRGKPGERMGANWRIPLAQKTGEVRHVVFDANHWKSFTHTRFATAMGERGCYSLFGRHPQLDAKKPSNVLRGDFHRGFASNIVAEYRVVTEGRGRKCDEWSIRPERPDNHWLDCMSMAGIGASMQGASTTGAEQARGGRMRKKRRMKQLT